MADLILGFSDYRPQGQRLAEALGRPYAEVELHRFPDGESKLTLPESLPRSVILCRSLDRPNDKLIELLLAAKSARAQGVEELTLVAPYLCYMRQDCAFQPGEAISQTIIGGFLAELFDTLLTVDPHLHRISRLEQAVPARRAVSLSATGPMRSYIQQHYPEALLLGPDVESRQWVQAIAEPAGLDYGVASKQRLGDKQVRIELPELPYRGREVVIIDDMASTGRTLMGVAEQLRQAGAEAVHCLVTHALFSERVSAQLHESGIQSLLSSDSVSHPSNALHLAPLLADALRQDT